MSNVTRVDQLIQLKRYAEARNLAREVLSGDPDNDYLLRLYARALAELGEFDEALEAIDAAVGLNPQHSDHHARRGDILSRMGKRDAAFEAIDQAIKLEPTSAFAHMVVVDAYNSGVARTPNKHAVEFRKLKSSRDAMMRLYPEMAASHFADACVHFRNSEYDLCLQAADRALAINPNDPAAYNARGLALRKLGRIEEAGDSFVAMGKLEPESSASSDLLARLKPKSWPIGIIGFFFLRSIVRGARQAGMSSDGIATITVLAIAAFIIYRWRKRRRKDHLSPEARQVLETRKKLKKRSRLHR